MTPLPPQPPGHPPHPGSDPPAAGASTWTRIDALFHEAAGLDAQGRAALLARVAREEAALAAELASLLEAHDRATGFLDRPAALEAAAAPRFERLGPYRIAGEIGRGGMGVVYRAQRDDENFTKDVAIKLIDPGLRSDEILDRFRRERQILAMLDHPNIARLLDGGTAPDGSPYLVMEYVEGRPLLDFCDERNLGIDERVALFLKVCDAVQFAHQRLVVHRDLKSDNVLVGADGSPRLLDFGIARVIAADGDDRPLTVTAPMHRMLTPDYASPEQVRGEPAAVASDVYSLGAILYELLTGSRPLRFVTRSPEEILRVVTQDDPPPPSTQIARAGESTALRRRESTARLRRRLAGDLDFVTLKALEKDPRRRYGSVDQLAQDIRRHLEGLPVLARGQSTAYRVSRFVRRHRAGVIAGSLVAVSLIAGLVGTTWQAAVASRERDRAQRRFDDVRALAHAVMFDIHDAIANLPGSTPARETLVRHALRYLDGLAREAKGDGSLQHEMAIAYAKIGDVQGRPMFPNLGQTGPALESYRKALGLIEESVRAEPDSVNFLRDHFVVSQRMADLLNVMGRGDEAMERSLDSRARIVAELRKRPDDPLLLGDLSVAANRLTDLKLAAGDTLGAIAECRTNLSLAERFFHEDPKRPESRRGALIAMAKMANLQAARGAPDSASAFYLRAEQLAREAVAALPHNTDASRDLSIVYGMRGLFLAEQGTLDSALVVYGYGMRICEELAAENPTSALQQSDLAAGHFEIGTMLVKGRRFADAERRFVTAYEAYVRLAAADTGNAENRIWMARAARQAGESSRSLGQRARAIDWLAKSHTQYRALARSGALQGEEAAAPREVEALLSAVRARP